MDTLPSSDKVPTPPSAWAEIHSGHTPNACFSRILWLFFYWKSYSIWWILLRKIHLLEGSRVGLIIFLTAKKQYQCAENLQSKTIKIPILLCGEIWKASFVMSKTKLKLKMLIPILQWNYNWWSDLYNLSLISFHIHVETDYISNLANQLQMF